jgi:hypothetical protein
MFMVRGDHNHDHGHHNHKKKKKTPTPAFLSPKKFAVVCCGYEYSIPTIPGIAGTT